MLSSEREVDAGHAAKLAGAEPLEKEARAFLRYIGQDAATQECIARYVGANQRLVIAARYSALDFRVVTMATNHPWTIAHLDSVLALIGPNSLFRNKLLILTAILETNHKNVDRFLPREFSIVSLLFTLTTVALSASARLVVGLALYLWAAIGVDRDR